MNKEDFKTPNGKFVKIKVLWGTDYAFIPKNLPPEVNYDKNLTFLLSEADRSFSRLAGLGLNIPNPYILILPYIKKEAVLSSKIEGTQASLTDLFLYELEKRKPKENRLGLREVSNYVVTTEKALKLLKEKKEISLDLIKYLHNILLRGVRGSDRNPGHFKITQNAIVPYKNCPPEEIILIPPPPKETRRLMIDLEKFIQGQQRIPVLIQAAILHYQFETIHPFGDGNGRIGRLLITLYLMKKGDMRHALLYLSAFLEKNRKDYYNRLLKVSQDSDWTGWIKYFLTAVLVQSTETIENVEKLLNLKKRYDNYLRKAKVSNNVKMLVEELFKNPYITPNNVAIFLNVSFPTAINTIRTLERLGLLKEHGKRKRNKVYKAIEILKVLEAE